MKEFSKLKPGRIPLSRDGVESGYVVSEELAEAIGVALLLHRPLLVTGDPGTGKTTLALALATALDQPLLEFNCKSTSIGRDLLYQFDHLQRLYDAQRSDTAKKTAADYVTFQALGEAIKSAKPYVVLIDEIDKAPRDFPNDLLNEIGRARFTIPEVGDGKVYASKTPPTIVITSNSERQLPPAFLRRCTYHHIEYPGSGELREIVALHTADLAPSPKLIEMAVTRFKQIRDTPGLIKQPATDELIAWTRVLHALGVDAERLEQGALAELPGMSAVLKGREDLKRIRG